MKSIKEYRTLIIIVLSILILIGVKTFAVSHFKSDSKKWAAPSFSHGNVMSVEKAGKLPGKKLIISLDKTASGLSGTDIAEINIPATEVISQFDKISGHAGPVILFSKDQALTARIWMILSQMGRKDLYFLSAGTGEAFQYEFRPDTLAKPEL